MFCKYSKNKLVKIGSNTGKPRYIYDPDTGIFTFRDRYSYLGPYRFVDEHFIREFHRLRPTDPTHHDVLTRPGTYFDTELPDFINDPFWRKVLVNLGGAVTNPEEFEKVVVHLDSLASRSKDVADELRRKANEIKVRYDWIMKRTDQIDNWVEYLKLGPAEYENKKRKHSELFGPVSSLLAAKRRAEETGAKNNVENTASINKDSGSTYTGTASGNTWYDWFSKNYVTVGAAGVTALAALAGIYALYRYLRNRKKKTWR